MSTILPVVNTFDADIIVPDPGEYVRAGGGIGTPFDITGVGGDINGTITYEGIVAFVRTRHLGGISQTLATIVSGTDITVQLGTNSSGVVTSTAAAVVASVLSLASALVSAVARGTGAGHPSVSDWVELSFGAQGSVRPAFTSLSNRTNFLHQLSNDFLLTTGYYTPIHPIMTAYCVDKTNIMIPMPSPAHVGRSAVNVPLYVPSNTSPSTINVTNLDGYTMGTLFAANSWYYIYIDSALNFGITAANPPLDKSYNFESGGGNRKYIGSFKTDASKDIIRYMQSGRSYKFYKPQLLTAPFTAPVTGTFVLPLDAVSDAAGVSPIATAVNTTLELINSTMHSGFDGVNLGLYSSALIAYSLNNFVVTHITLDGGINYDVGNGAPYYFIYGNLPSGTPQLNINVYVNGYTE